MRFLRRLSPLIITGSCAFACGRARDDVKGIRDSAGVRIVEQRTRAVSGTPHFVIDSVPEIDIGADADDARYEFSNVSGAVRLDDGRFVVVNGGTSEIRFYNSRGRYELTAGRPGDGPGEFRGAGPVFQIGDSIAVFDYQLRRVTSLSHSGAIAAVAPVTAVLPVGGIDPVGRLSDGTWIGVALILPAAPSPVIQHDTVVVVRLSRGLDSVLGLIGRFAGADDFLTGSAAGQSVRSYGVPFGAETHVLTRKDLIYVGDAAAAEVRVYRPDGQLTRVIRGVGNRRPISAADIAEAKEREIAEGGSRAAAGVERRWAIVPVPKLHPAFTDLTIDAVGRLWAFGAAGREGGATMVFDEEGRYMAEAHLPRRLSVAQIDREYILGIQPDSNNAEHVQVYGYRRE